MKKDDAHRAKMQHKRELRSMTNEQREEQRLANLKARATRQMRVTEDASLKQRRTMSAAEAQAVVAMIGGVVIGAGLPLRAMRPGPFDEPKQ